MSSPNPKLTLVYFPFSGRAESIRLTAAAGGLPFTNKAMAFPDFKEAQTKGTLPLGQLPVLEIESTDQEGKTHTSTVTQTSAILRYFGKKAGLYPTDEMEAIKVDEYICILDDLIQPLVMSIMGAVKALVSDTEWTSEEKIGLRQKWLESTMPKYLGKVEEDLKKSESGWLVGDSVSIADLRLFTELTWIESGILGRCTIRVELFHPCVSNNGD